jgi:RNA polymerase sigma-70 factor (ECF subfamily)
MTATNCGLDLGPDRLEVRLGQHRAELTSYCHRVLGSPSEAEDAVQETMLRAWRGFDRFEGRAALRSWLYRIATNVCHDSLTRRARRAIPVDLSPAAAPIAELAGPRASWIAPRGASLLATAADPAEVTLARETVRLAFIAALRHLPARQRAVLILRDVLRWKASEVAELLDTSIASVNSALQRAHATLESAGVSAAQAAPILVDESHLGLLSRYVQAFEADDFDSLTSLIREDAHV